MQRMCIEAFQQGGLLTIEDLANRLFNCGQRTLSRDLEALRRQGIVLPLRSMIKDMGRSISHRSLIIEQWLKGKEYSEIARHTHHSISSVQNYVSKFKRIVALAEEGYDIHTIAFLVKVSASLAESYHELYRRMKIVPHRLKELKSFPKKGTHQTPIARWQ
jgi:transposase